MKRDKKGRFIKGRHYGKATEFKKGQHWRDKKVYWDKEWLYNEYIVKNRSSQEIANQFGCKDANILYFLRKHKIKARNVSEARAVKHWGQSGEKNPMFGKRGKEVPSWNGGCTPERQLFYSSIEWKKVRRKVWIKYGHQCQRCHKKGGNINTKKEKGVYQLHHIVSFRIKNLRVNENNLIVLCKACHLWVHSKKNTKKEFILTQEQFNEKYRRKDAADKYDG